MSFPYSILNRVKNGHSVLFAKKNTGFQCSILNTSFKCSILNTDQHGKNTKFFSLKYGSPHIDLNHLEKNF